MSARLVSRELQTASEKVESIARKENSNAITICGDMEAEIAELPKDEQQVFLNALGIQESGLSKLIREAYNLLGLITFYTTVGPELRAWTVPRGSKAPEAAGKIHSDMEKGFIKADIIHYRRFYQNGQPVFSEGGRANQNRRKRLYNSRWRYCLLQI